MTDFAYTDASGTPICTATPTTSINGKFYVDVKLANGRSGTPNPRPLYRLPDLTSAELVVLVGSEEIADALAAEEITTTTILGGSSGIDATDWSPLNRADVTIILCRDKSPTTRTTRSWVKRIRERLPAISDDNLFVVEPPRDAPDGWTLAAPVADGEFDFDRFLSSGIPYAEFAKPRKDAIVPKDFADAILEAHAGQVISLGDKKPTFYAYHGDADLWRSTSDQVFRREALDLIGQQATAKLLDGVVSLLHTICHREDNPFASTPRDRIIHAADVDIRVHEDGTLEPLERDPLRYTLSRLATPFVHDGNTECLIFRKFLDQTFSGDEDQAEKIAFVQELLGLCLLPSPQYPLFTILYGQGANGKSVLLEIIGALVGEANMAAVGIEDFSRQFGQTNLVGKLVNLVGEIGVGNLIDDRLMKLTTSGDAMQVDRKYHDPFMTRIHVKTILSTNTIPHVRDLSHAVRRRLRFISFNNVVVDRAQNRGLARQIIDNPSEMTGILHWAIDGLVRLIGHGVISDPPSSEEAVADWSDDADPIGRFIRDACVLGDYRIEKDMLVGAYLAWCGEKSVRHPLGKTGFTNALRSYQGGPISTGHSGDTRFYQGITLKSLAIAEHSKRVQRFPALVRAA